jgi:hypothetical protein
MRRPDADPQMRHLALARLGPRQQPRTVRERFPI